MKFFSLVKLFKRVPFNGKELATLGTFQRKRLTLLRWTARKQEAPCFRPKASNKTNLYVSIVRDPGEKGEIQICECSCESNFFIVS